MPKGRRANPSTVRDGAWFQHSRLLMYPESLTASEQKQILNLESVRQIESRLPLMYKLREKKPANTFPFSVHDNRDCLLNVGEFLDSIKQFMFCISSKPEPSCKLLAEILKIHRHLCDIGIMGLGRRKFKRETCQHHAQNSSFVAHEPILSSTSYCTMYQTSFVPYPNTEQPFPGRFPKSHVERSKALKPLSKDNCIWFSEDCTRPDNLIPGDPVTNTLLAPKELSDAQPME